MHHMTRSRFLGGKVSCLSLPAYYIVCEHESGMDNVSTERQLALPMLAVT